MGTSNRRLGTVWDMNLTTTESLRVLRQLQRDGAKTQTERNKLGQFATPTALATDILKYAKTLLPADQKIRFSKLRH